MKDASAFVPQKRVVCNKKKADGLSNRWEAKKSSALSEIERKASNIQHL